MYQISILNAALIEVMDELTRVEQEVKAGNRIDATLEDYKSRLNARVEFHIKAMAEKGK